MTKWKVGYVRAQVHGYRLLRPTFGHAGCTGSPSWSRPRPRLGESSHHARRARGCSLRKGCPLWAAAMALQSKQGRRRERSAEELASRNPEVLANRAAGDGVKRDELPACFAFLIDGDTLTVEIAEPQVSCSCRLQIAGLDQHGREDRFVERLQSCHFRAQASARSSIRSSSANTSIPVCVRMASMRPSSANMSFFTVAM
jgi:hypothetical protein